MACYSPKYAIQVNEGSKLQFLNAADALKFKNFDDVKSAEKFASSSGARFLTIPCGDCLGCRLDESKQWAIRCALEAKYYSKNVFVTLTYENPPINIVRNVNNDDFPTDEFTGFTLKKRDLQLFIKRLRSHFDYHYNQKIRHFSCGEYGEGGRPHYHSILFNCDIPDLFYYGLSKSGFPLYMSPTLSDLWGKGFVFISPFSFKTAAYVARYVMKKANEISVADIYELEPEFRIMSRRPGIGKRYFEDFKERIYEFDEINVPTFDDKPIISAPPKFFDTLAAKEFPELLEEIKLQRKEKSDILRDVELLQTDKNMVAYNHVKFVNKEYSLSKLKRSL